MTCDRFGRPSVTLKTTGKVSAFLQPSNPYLLESCPLITPLLHRDHHHLHEGVTNAFGRNGRIFCDR